MPAIHLSCLSLGYELDLLTDSTDMGEAHSMLLLCAEPVSAGHRGYEGRAHQKCGGLPRTILAGASQQCACVQREAVGLLFNVVVTIFPGDPACSCIINKFCYLLVTKRVCGGSACGAGHEAEDEGHGEQAGAGGLWQPVWAVGAVGFAGWLSASFPQQCVGISVMAC